jgi:uncharacterized protein (TIGR01777 family)
VKIVISGGSGFIGRALMPALREAGHDVVRLVRHAPAAPDERSWDPGAGRLELADLAGVDAGICLSGAGVGDHRWTGAYQDTILASRVDSTRLLASSFAALRPRPQVLLAASAIGWYGDRGDEELDEWSSPGTGFLADVVRRWEQAADPARDAGVRVCHPRSGLVQGLSGGALARQLPLFRFGLGGRLGSGRQWQSWITLEDEVRALLFLLSAPSVAGAVNLTAPQPVRQRDLAEALGQVLNRPTVVPTPALALKAVLGGFASEVLASQRVVPHVLTTAGFAWTASDPVTAYARVLDRPAPS